MRARLLALGLATLLAFPLASAQLAPPVASPALPQAEPDVPAATAPVATLTVFENEVYSFTAGVRTRAITVPGAYDRVVLVFRETPEGDPWDRLFAAFVGGVEVLRGTTPRTDMTVRKDITEFRALLPEGGTSTAGIYTDTYVGLMRVTLKLEFYVDEPTGLAAVPADAVVPAHRFRWICADEARHDVQVTFPASAPGRATLELYTTGHGAGGEFWWLNYVWPQTFHVYVDGREVATAVAQPYLYAFLGFSGGFGVLVHPVMWWTAQQALDIAGVPDGVGSIPPYRAEILLDDLDLLQGARTVTLMAEGGGCVWPTSVNFLLHA